MFKFTKQNRCEIKVLEKLNSVEETCKKLQASEDSYRKLYKNQKIHEQILEILIALSNAIATGTVVENHIRDISRVVHKVFNITEIYYARIYPDGTYEKVRSFVNVDHKDLYTPRLSGSLTEVPDLMDSIMNGACYQIGNGDFSKADKPYYDSLKIVSACSCPIIIDGKVRGVLGFNKVLPEDWTNEEISLNKIFASLIATSIKRAKQDREVISSQNEAVRRCDIMITTMNMVDGFMWNKDENGRYKFCTPAWKQIFFHLPLDFDITGKTDVELLNDFRERTGLVHTFGNICSGTDEHSKNQGKTCYYIEIGFIGEDRFILDVVKTPQFTPDGTYVGTVGIARNRSRESIMTQLMLKNFIDKGLAVNLNPNMADERVTAYWIKDKQDHIDLFEGISGIFPR